MKTYIGTKMIKAQPMNRAEYNKYRGWELPSNESGADEGFLVEYLDGGKANDFRHQGYISWSPDEVFHNAYREVNAMTFGLAIEALKAGHTVARAGWNGKGMYLTLVSRSVLPPSHLPYIEMKTVDDKRVPWLASQTDVLAEDWTIVD